MSGKAHLYRTNRAIDSFLRQFAVSVDISDSAEMTFRPELT